MMMMMMMMMKPFVVVVVDRVMWLSYSEPKGATQ